MTTTSVSSTPRQSMLVLTVTLALVCGAAMAKDFAVLQPISDKPEQMANGNYYVPSSLQTVSWGRAPSVVAVSSTTASRILVRLPFKNEEALPHEQAITDTMLAPMAVWMSTPPSVVRIGTTKMPLAMPSMPPKALEPSATANSHKPK